MNVTDYELTLLRQQPHKTTLYLSVYKPNTVLACRVNNISIAKGERTIAYDSVTAGSYLSVESGMTMLVGTTLGGSEKGRIRVKSINASQIVVAENSHVNWQDNDYLTIVNFFEINAIYPRIIQDPNDEMDVIFYKDYDIAYTNQNQNLGSFFCMGSHYAGFRNDQVYYSASGTANLSGDSLTFNWWFQGANTTGSSADIPGYVTYDTPGHYTTRLTAVSSSGVTGTSYRHISIYDKPGEGSNTPFIDWEFDRIVGSKDGGGYTGDIRIHLGENVNTSSVVDGALVVMFSDDFYGNTNISIGGNAKNRSKIFFVGYILNGTIQYNYQHGYVDFSVGSPTEVMKLAEGFSISVESKPNANKWFKMRDLSCKKGIYHFLEWHSTVLKCTDFEWIGEDRLIQYYDADRTSLYDAVNGLMSSALFGNIVSDRQGKLFAEISVMATNNASGTFLNAMNIDKSVWVGEPIIDEIQTNETSFIEMGGVAYSGNTTGTFSALLCSAPGNAPGYRGGVERIQGLALLGQDQLNQLAGNVLAYRNARYPNVFINFAGAYRNLDIAPNELVSLNVAATDTPRGIVFNQKPFELLDMEWSYDPSTKLLLPSSNLHEVTQGFAADTIVIPDVPPTEGDGTSGGGFDIPTLTVPPLPIPTIFTGIAWDEIVGVDTTVPVQTPPNYLFDQFITGISFYPPYTGWYLLGVNLTVDFTDTTNSDYFSLVVMYNEFNDDPNDPQLWTPIPRGTLGTAVRSGDFQIGNSGLHEDFFSGKWHIVYMYQGINTKLALYDGKCQFGITIGASRTDGPALTWIYLGNPT